jgi:hypothetical protein
MLVTLFSLFNDRNMYVWYPQMMKNYAELQAGAPIAHLAAGLKEYKLEKRKKEVRKKEKQKGKATAAADDEDGEEEDEDEEEGAPAKKQKKDTASSKKDKGKVKDYRNKSGLKKLKVVSEALRNALQCDPQLPRNEVIECFHSSIPFLYTILVPIIRS